MSFFTNLDFHQIIFAVILFLFAAVLLKALLRRDKDQGSKISLDDLLIGDDGKTSKVAAVMFGAFILSTWVIVNLTMTGHLTEGFYSAYLAAWVAPTVARIIKGPNNANP